MKRKFKIFVLAALIASSFCFQANFCQAYSINTVSQVKTASPQGDIDISLSIAGKDFEKNSGISAGDIFTIYSGLYTNIISINSEDEYVWKNGERIATFEKDDKKIPKTVYVKSGEKFVLLKDNKVDLKDVLKSEFKKEGIDFKAETAILDFGENPITITKTDKNHLKVQAMDKVKIDQKIRNLVEHLANSASNTQISTDIKVQLVRKLKKVPNQSDVRELMEKVIKSIQNSDTAKQFSINTDLEIRFEGATGIREIQILPQKGSTVTKESLKIANIKENLMTDLDIEIITPDNLYFTENGKNESRITIRVKKDKDKDKDDYFPTKTIKLILPKDFTWNESYIPNKNAEIVRSIPNPNQMKIELKNDKDIDIIFDLSVHPLPYAKDGTIKMKVTEDEKLIQDINLAKYNKKSKQERMVKTVFTINKNQYKKGTMLYSMDQSPFAYNGRIMLPVRYLADAIDVKVDYDNNSKTAIFSKGDTKVEAKAQIKDKIFINGKEKKLSANMQARNGRIFLPLSDIAQAFSLKYGEDLLWNQQEQTVTVITIPQ